MTLPGGTARARSVNGKFPCNAPAEYWITTASDCAVALLGVVVSESATGVESIAGAPGAGDGGVICHCALVTAVRAFGSYAVAASNSVAAFSAASSAIRLDSFGRSFVART